VIEIFHMQLSIGSELLLKKNMGRNNIFAMNGRDITVQYWSHYLHLYYAIDFNANSGYSCVRMLSSLSAALSVSLYAQDRNFAGPSFHDIVVPCRRGLLVF